MAFFEKLKNAASRFSAGKAETPKEKQEPEAAGITMDDVIRSIDDCKASLIAAELPPEDVSRYSDALSAIQQALRGLHAVTDITDLLDALNLVFSTSMGLTFNFGGSEDCTEAIKMISAAVKAIPSTKNDDVLIAALQLNILAQNALILHQRQIITRYQTEIDNYHSEQRALLAQSTAKSASELSAFDRNMFQQIEDRVEMREGRIEGARMLISTYNQEILSFESSIESIRINPRAYQTADVKERMRALRAKAPNGSELAAMIEEAAKEASVIAAESKAEMKRMREMIDENLPVIDAETERKIEEAFAEMNGCAQTQEAPEQTENNVIIM